MLADDPSYVSRAIEWDNKVKDIHEWLAQIGIEKPSASANQKVTYHEACHLCHGQKITAQPRQVLKSIPGLELVELPESTWCCGSAGIYNIIQPPSQGCFFQQDVSGVVMPEKLGAASHHQHVERLNVVRSMIRVSR